MTSTARTVWVQIPRGANIFRIGIRKLFFTTCTAMLNSTDAKLMVLRKHIITHKAVAHLSYPTGVGSNLTRSQYLPTYISAFFLYRWRDAPQLRHKTWCTWCKHNNAWCSVTFAVFNGRVFKSHPLSVFPFNCLVRTFPAIPPRLLAVTSPKLGYLAKGLIRVMWLYLHPPE